MLVTSHVFLDTEVFHRENFNFSSSRFRRLRELGSEGRLRIYLTALVSQEVNIGIRERVRNAATVLQKASKPDAAGVLRNSTRISFEQLFSFSEEAIVQELHDQFGEFKYDASVEIIPVDNVSVGEIFDRYFTIRPPFKEGRKRSEFPDAFSLLAVSLWCHQRGFPAYVVSSDSDWASFCEHDDLLVSLDSVDALLDLVASEDKLAETAREIYRNLREEIEKQVSDRFMMLGFFLDDQDGDVDEVDIIAVETLGEFLLSLEDDVAIFGVDFRVTYDAAVVYDDPRFGYYDNEERTYYSMRSIRKHVKTDADMFAEVFVDLQNLRLGELRFPKSSDIAVTVESYQDYK